MRIWILKASEPTPYDVKMRGSRLFRYGMLAQHAAELGHDVLWWTDDFDHFHKQHRFGEDCVDKPFPRCSVHFVHTPGYRRNASLRRFRDHALLAARIEEIAERFPEPDVILAGMPCDHLCVAAVRLGRRFGVPVVLDVRDLWPDVFYTQVPSILHPLLKVLTRSFERRTRWAFSRADAVVGNSRPFVEWGLRKAGRPWGSLDRMFPIGYKEPQITSEQLEGGFAFWRKFGVTQQDGIFTICFLGNFGPMYDFSPVIEAARILKQQQASIRFVLCGGGTRLEATRREVAGLNNVLLPGWVNTEQIVSLLRMSHVGLAPYKDVQNFRDNLPNKPAEYLSSSLPILVSIPGQMLALIRKYQCGRQYTSANELVEAIQAYQNNPGLYDLERENARRAFSEQLDADVIYRDLVHHLEKIRNTRYIRKENPLLVG